MRRVLVLGASGFIGKRLVQALALSGWAQAIAGRHYSSIDAKDGAAIVVVDSTNAESMQKALAGVHDVINCVAGGERAISTGARILFEAAAHAKNVERIVHLSTMSVYGSATGLVGESTPLNGDLNWYSRAKVEAEQRAQAYARSGRAIVILRPGCVYGPESELWTGRIGRWLRAGRIGDLGAAGDGICNLVLIDDVVTAVLAALSTPGIEGQAVNLANPAPETWNRYFSRFARAIGAVPVRRISGRRLRIETKLLAPPLKVGELIGRRIGLNGGRLPEPIPPSLAKLWQQEIRLDPRRAEQLLGLRWTSIRDGMAAAARWFLATYPEANHS